MMHKAWCSIDKVPYSFPRSSIKFESHKGQKHADFNMNWAFLDCNFSLNSPMALKWCTKLHIVWKRCPIVFSCDQAAIWLVQSVHLSVRPSVCLSVTPFSPCSHHRIIMKFSGEITNDKSNVHAKGQGQRSRSQRSTPNLTVSGL